MIKKPRREFIILTASVLLLVFLIVYGLIYYFSFREHNKSIYNNLTSIHQVYEKTGQTMNDTDFIVNFIYLDANNVQYNANIIYNESYFSEYEIEQIIDTIIIKNFGYGNVDNVYYKYIYGENPLIIASDMTETIKLYKKTAINSLIVVSTAYSLSLLILYALSLRVIKPIKDSIYRQLQFISNVSHELKTPVAIISANAEVLSSIEQNQWVDNIKDQTSRMETLVSNMLTLAKLDENGFNLKKEKVNLSNLVIASTLPFDSLAFESGKVIELDVKENVNVEIDTESIKTVLSILIDNAVKYADKNSVIRVSLLDASHPTIIVKNQGSEVSDTDSEKIFERFYRGDNSRSRETGGTGLGLSIAHSICTLNKWKISAKSIYHESMTITVTL